MEIHNKVILITGASSGIGRAVAVKLAAKNNRIAITARRRDLLKEVAAEIEAAGSECLVFPGDATDAARAEKAVAAVSKRWGRIDIAVLNVGAGPVSNLTRASAESITDCMRINYDSMVHFYVPLIRQMKTQTSECLIAHINSLASYFGLPMQGDYTAAKAAARIFLETARMELKHFGFNHISIQTIHPGFINTKPKKDALPRPGELSTDAAVEQILRAIASGKPEVRFPFGTAFATRIGRIAPRWLKTFILLKAARKSY